MDKTYDEFINEILMSRGRFACGEEYHETHHVIPKCMGGSNDKDNLIDLFAREHFEAHRLLALEHPENDELMYAWACMAWMKSGNQNRVELTPEEYEEIKKKYSEMCSKRYAGENNPMYGISPRERMDEETYNTWRQKIIEFNTSEQSRQNRRKKNIGKTYPDEVNKKKGRSGSEHHMYGKHHTDEAKQKLREAHTGRTQTEETRKKISAAMTGENNPFYGKTHSEESRKRISEAKKGKPNKVKGENKPNAKRIVQYDLNGNFVRVWSYMKQASDALGISYTGINACCNDRQKTAGGFIWKCFNEEEFSYAKNISV